MGKKASMLARKRFSLRTREGKGKRKKTKGKLRGRAREGLTEGMGRRREGKCARGLNAYLE